MDDVREGLEVRVGLAATLCDGCFRSKCVGQGKRVTVAIYSLRPGCHDSSGARVTFRPMWSGKAPRDSAAIKDK